MPRLDHKWQQLHVTPKPPNKRSQSGWWSVENRHLPVRFVRKAGLIWRLVVLLFLTQILARSERKQRHHMTANCLTFTNGINLLMGLALEVHTSDIALQ